MSVHLNRRQLLKALGLGTLTGFLPSLLGAPRARAASSPSRIVFFIQPHGHVPSAWTLPMPDAPSDRFAERTLLGTQPAELSEVLRPLHPFRDRLLVIEGLAHTSVLADRAQVLRTSGDDNNHQLGVAGLLTGTRALQRSGVPSSGGARSLDQVLADRTAGAGRFASRVYGADYRPNQTVSPFSFLGPGQPAPVVADPSAGFNDLMGMVAPGADHEESSREDLIQALRGSVLDAVAQEYAAIAPKLGREDALKLQTHRDLVRDLERNLAAGVPAMCDLSFNASGDRISPFMRLIRIALACDLTRVVTYVAPVPLCPDFGYPADASVHLTYAHGSVPGATSCGQAYSALAERAMTDLGVWYARHFAELLSELDAVPEGDGTLLDHTTVVWLTELATPTHLFNDTFAVIAGGTCGKLKMGRYVRYPRTYSNPFKDWPVLGPGLNRLHVSLLQAMGQTDTSFGMTETQGADGKRVPLTGALDELRSSG